MSENNLGLCHGCLDSNVKLVSEFLCQSCYNAKIKRRGK